MRKLSTPPISQTQWIIKIDRREVEAEFDWARNFLARYDTSQLASVRVGIGRGRATGVYGRCWYPTAEMPLYRISCQVPGPFPCRIPVRRSPVYRLSDGRWPPIPEGCIEGLSCSAEKGGALLEWKRVIGYTEVLTRGEGLVWIMAHEFFHFLKRTGQVEGRNTEIEADGFADDQLMTLRRLRARWSK